jgi:hypothetical protein
MRRPLLELAACATEARSQQKEALIFRNRLVTLLEERVTKMRRAQKTSAATTQEVSS